MKNYSITTALVFSLMTLSHTPAFASGMVMYRSVTSNNIFQCSTNQQIETVWQGGNTTHVGASHLLICLDGNRQAKWIVDSVLTCQSSFANPQNCQINLLNGGAVIKSDSENTLVFKPKKTGIGTNCNIVKKIGEYNTVFYNWSCEKYSSRQNLTIVTKGDTSLESASSLYDKYGKIPSQLQLTNPDDPNCVEDESTCQEDYPGLGGDPAKLDPRTYIDCRGDAQYCDWYYSLDS